MAGAGGAEHTVVCSSKLTQCEVAATLEHWWVSLCASPKIKDDAGGRGEREHIDSPSRPPTLSTNTCQFVFVSVHLV